MKMASVFQRIAGPCGALFALTSLCGAAHADDFTFSHEDVSIVFDGELLTIANAAIERRWTVQDGLLHNAGLTRIGADGVRHEYLAGNTEELSASPLPWADLADAADGAVVSASVEDGAANQEPYVLVSVAQERADDAGVRSMIRIYPGFPAISTWVELEGELDDGGALKITDFTEFESESQDIAGDESQRFDPFPRKAASDIGVTTRTIIDHTQDVAEIFPLGAFHPVVTRVTLLDDTDRQDNLAHDDRYTLSSATALFGLNGNLFYVDETLTENGFAVLKEAPLRHARPVKRAYDLGVRGRTLTVKDLGLAEDTPDPENFPIRASYPVTTIVYAGDEAERTATLHGYQRLFWRFDAERDLKIWHCTWGDRNRDGRLSEEFLSRELDVIIEVGSDHLYFTDGWQNGPSSNSVTPGGLWEGQTADPGYWEVNTTRYPNGKEPLLERAAEHGVQTGHWFNPDKTNSYENWERDADKMLELHRRYGHLNVKFDGVAFFDKLGEQRLVAAMERVVNGSGGQYAVEVDITAGIRTGYFSAMEYGFIFLENRYTDWHNYYPHSALRNLWDLSHHVDPRRIRVEFLNNARRADVYGDDPLAPQTYSFDYVFATTFMGQPLAWFEFTGLSQEQKDLFRESIAGYKPHRAKIHENLTTPIGEQPSGVSWTGFVNCDAACEEGYLLVFREVNERNSHVFTSTRLDAGVYTLESILGESLGETVTVDEDGHFTVSMIDPRSYAFVRFVRQ